jgi:hypothetical protein
MLRLRWTAVGDLEEVARMLAWVPSLGRLTTHGHGWVQRWEVRRGGPGFLRYISDPTLRHIPVAEHQPDLRLAGRLTTKRLPLTPPYHERVRAVEVVQMAEVA